MPVPSSLPLRPSIQLQTSGANPAPARHPEERGSLSRIFAITLAALVLTSITGCASDKAGRPNGHRWYQGDMDNDERAFFLDSFADR